MEWYLKSHTFAEKNDVFQKTALELEGFKESSQDPADIDGVVFVSNRIDSYLMGTLFQGTLPECQSGGKLARAAEMVQARNSVAVLLVSVEVCSISFQIEDKSLANLASLFADGAAAVVVGIGVWK